MKPSPKKCAPCAKGIPPLSESAARQKLSSVPSWQLAEGGKALRREVKLKDWKEAFALVQRIDALAERENHHPDIAFGWGYCTLTLSTHRIGGLHENDFIMAGEISRLIEGEPR
jgi:4a-hydroxytetrahydrobiopterin dehydratase